MDGDSKTPQSRWKLTEDDDAITLWGPRGAKFGCSSLLFAVAFGVAAYLGVRNTTFERAPDGGLPWFDFVSVPFLLLPIAVSLVAAVAFLYSLLGRRVYSFDREEWSLRWSLLGIGYTRRLPVSEIESLAEDTLYRVNDSPVLGLVAAARSGSTLKFGSDLEPSERAWLRQRLQAFLADAATPETPRARGAPPGCKIEEGRDGVTLVARTRSGLNIFLVFWGLMLVMVFVGMLFGFFQDRPFEDLGWFEGTFLGCISLVGLVFVISTLRALGRVFGSVQVHLGSDEVVIRSGFLSRTRSFDPALVQSITSLPTSAGGIVVLAHKTIEFAHTLGSDKKDWVVRELRSRLLDEASGPPTGIAERLAATVPSLGEAGTGAHPRVAPEINLPAPGDPGPPPGCRFDRQGSTQLLVARSGVSWASLFPLFFLLVWNGGLLLIGYFVTFGGGHWTSESAPYLLYPLLAVMLGIGLSLLAAHVSRLFGGVRLTVDGDLVSVREGPLARPKRFNLGEVTAVSLGTTRVDEGAGDPCVVIEAASRTEIGKLLPPYRRQWLVASLRELVARRRHLGGGRTR